MGPGFMEVAGQRRVRLACVLLHLLVPRRWISSSAERTAYVLKSRSNCSVVSADATVAGSRCVESMLREPNTPFSQAAALLLEEGFDLRGCPTVPEPAMACRCWRLHSGKNLLGAVWDSAGCLSTFDWIPRPSFLVSSEVRVRLLSV